MEKKTKYYKDIEIKFQSNDEKVILHALHEISRNGKAEIVPLMFDLLQKHKKDIITEEVFTIMDQIKDRNVVPFVVAELELNHSERYRTRLITACWQSGLDYSEHILVFSKQFVEGDYLRAIEAFSVIEENIHNAAGQTVQKCKEYLIKNLSKISNDKKPLHIELVKLVECYL